MIWSINAGTAKKGDIAGSDIGRGYRQIKFRGKRYLAHRVSFLKFYGFLPEYVDHIDGDTKNNNPENLRPATRSQNMINRKNQKNSKSKRLGIDFMTRDGVWRAQIHVKGKKIYLGIFKSFLDAVAERIRAEKLYHGEYSRK